MLMLEKILRRVCCFVFACSVCLVFCADSFAHYPWIQLEEYSLESKDELSMTVGWGHGFPALASFLENDRIAEIFVLEHSGKRLFSMKAESRFTFKSKKELMQGSYQVSSYTPGYSSKTPSGYKQQSKKELDRVIQCKHNHWGLKAIVNVGDVANAPYAPVGHPLEIVPLKNPGSLEEGESLPVQVLFKEKPLENIEIQATCLRQFSAEQEYSQTVQTDEQGRADIKLTHPDMWLLKAYYQQPFPDTEVCDLEAYLSTLTFELQ